MKQKLTCGVLPGWALRSASQGGGARRVGAVTVATAPLAVSAGAPLVALGALGMPGNVPVVMPPLVGEVTGVVWVSSSAIAGSGAAGSGSPITSRPGMDSMSGALGVCVVAGCVPQGLGVASAVSGIVSPGARSG